MLILKKRFIITKIHGIVKNVLADAVQFLFIPNDPVIVPALPDRQSWISPVLIDLAGRKSFEDPYELRQTMELLGRGGFQTRPYQVGFCLNNPVNYDYAMKMVRHYDIFIQFNPIIMVG